MADDSRLPRWQREKLAPGAISIMGRMGLKPLLHAQFRAEVEACLSTEQRF